MGTIVVIDLKLMRLIVNKNRALLLKRVRVIDLKLMRSEIGSKGKLVVRLHPWAQIQTKYDKSRII